MRRDFLFIAALSIAAILSYPLRAQDVVTITTCPGADPPQVPLQVDCSAVADPATKALCRPFAENQACRVFPAYRKITGIHMEDLCPAIKYTIYDQDKWPYQDSKDGGRAARCGAQILTEVSLRNTSPQIGPFDVHELLHVYQTALGAIPYEHILFGPSMTEARRMIGDNTGYATEFVNMKQEFNHEKVAYETGKVGGDNPCLQAELYEEKWLYMKDHNNVYQFYAKLQHGMLKDMADRTARFNRMYDAVSAGEAKPFLLAHGCPPF